jgi:hypothetical protein
MLVAISLTGVKEKNSSDTFRYFPAVIDTGFNGIMALNINHAKKLLNNNSLQSYKLRDEDTDSQGRKRYLINANIWLYKTRYEYPRGVPNQFPHLFDEDTNIKVYDYNGSDGDVWPSLPLIGLDFFNANNLDLKLFTNAWRFEISRI